MRARVPSKASPTEMPHSTSWLCEVHACVVLLRMNHTSVSMLNCAKPLALRISHSIQILTADAEEVCATSEDQAWDHRQP
jgi:hypothetical protein